MVSEGAAAGEFTIGAAARLGHPTAESCSRKEEHDPCYMGVS